MRVLHIGHKPDLQSLLTGKKTQHVRNERVARLENVTGTFIEDAFLIFDENHPRSAVMHYITDAAEDIIYDLEGRRVITITMLRPNQLRRYYKKAEVRPNEHLMNMAFCNNAFRRNEL